MQEHLHIKKLLILYWRLLGVHWYR